LQADHFNDFVQVGLLRSALHRAVSDAGPDGLRHDTIASAVVQALGLPKDEYVREPDPRGLARQETDRALREAVGLLADIPAAQRESVTRVLLDEMRRSLAILW
jgi:hypothetical protein